MSGGCRIARFNSGNGCTHKAFKQSLDGVIQLAVFQCNRGLSSKRLNNFLLAWRISQHLGVNGFRGFSRAEKSRLALMSCNTAIIFFFLVADGHCQNRPGAIAGVFVKFAVDGVGNIRTEDDKRLQC